MVKGLFIGIIKTGAITIILSKALREFGKQDYAAIIKLGGMSLIGINILQIINYFMKNPPTVIKWIGNVISFFS